MQGIPGPPCLWLWGEHTGKRGSLSLLPAGCGEWLPPAYKPQLLPGRPVLMASLLQAPKPALLTCSGPGVPGGGGGGGCGWQPCCCPHPLHRVLSPDLTL